MLFSRRKLRLATDRLLLRPPAQSDFNQWRALREQGAGFLKPWEPTWAPDHLTRKSFSNRVYWSNRSITQKSAIPLLLFDHQSGVLVGAITLDNIRRGPSQEATLGYWVGEEFARQGYMSEAISAVVHYAFTHLDLSRVQAACLPENKASRGLLEKSGFKYEGVAQSYLQINGRWRNHVLYANLRNDRRGKTDVG